MGVTMRLQALFVLSVAAVGAILAAPAGAADPAVEAGLVAVQSNFLEQLYMRPNADLSGYKKVLIEPAQVSFRSDFNKNTQDSLGFLQRFRPDDVQRIAENVTDGLNSSVHEAFRARGYEIVASGGPGVLRLSPKVVDLFVNADETLRPGTTRAYTKDAGNATLVLEARDSVSGALLARVVDRRIVEENSKGMQITDVRQTGSVTNSFWFDSAFRRWATACANALETGTPAKVGLETHH